MLMTSAHLPEGWGAVLLPDRTAVVNPDVEWSDLPGLLLVSAWGTVCGHIEHVTICPWAKVPVCYSAAMSFKLVEAERIEA
jgi:hypothetical protein